MWQICLLIKIVVPTVYPLYVDCTNNYEDIFDHVDRSTDAITLKTSSITVNWPAEWTTTNSKAG